MKIYSMFFIMVSLIFASDIFCMNKPAIKYDHLDNKMCTAKNPDGTNQVVFRERTEKEKIQGIVWHYSTKDISGDLTYITKVSILNLIVNYYFYKDPLCAADEIFNARLNALLLQRKTMSALYDVINKYSENV